VGQGNGVSPICIAAMFTPANDSDAAAIMALVAQRNNARMGTSLTVEAATWTSLTAPARPLGFVPVPSEAFIYQYVQAQPNVTEYGTRTSRERDRGSTYLSNRVCMCVCMHMYVCMCV
jgi:hypothetical protein